jgi:hypothetical protein
MPRQKDTQPDTLKISADGPSVLVGQPSALRGDVHLRSTSPERVLLRSLPLTFAGKGAAALAAARAGPGPVVRLHPGIIRPGHTGPVSLSLALDPLTPPGEYQAQIEIAGQMQPVTLYVTERTSLSISPSLLVLENRPDQTISKRIVLRNQGNVPLNIGKLGAVYLDDDLQICRTLRDAAASVGDDLRPVEEYLARILLSAKHVAERSGILRIYNRAEDTPLQPGEVRPIDLEIRVPPTLDRRGRYRGVVALHTASLTFLIVPTGGPTPLDEEPAPKRRSSKGKTA